MAGYLVTRLLFSRLFRIADQSTVEEKVEQLFQQQQNLDAAALAMTDDILSPSSSSKNYSYKEILDTLAKASPTTRYTILSIAENNRSKNWRTNKPYMEKVIPIFQALTKTNPESHRPFGELGFALRDREKPDYQQSQEMLTEAIRLRDESHHSGYPYYEYVSAINKIQQDKDYKNKVPSSDVQKESIRKDLAAAKAEISDDEFQKLLQEDTDVATWISLNQPFTPPLP
jgi:hypothetical protein